MSKMVVLPKTTLYIGWLVCVLVIPVGHENEKGLAPVLLQVQAFCYMQICNFMIDGCAAARAIRYCGKADAETIPILAMTANAFDDDRQKSLSAGMNDYLSKPLDIPKLTEAIQKFRTTPTDNGRLVG